MENIEVPVRAPWTEEQVKNLQEWQASSTVHSFTCRQNSLHQLVPTVRGWICPFCDYTQDWAHDFMVSGEGLRHWRELTRSMCI